MVVSPCLPKKLPRMPDVLMRMDSLPLPRSRPRRRRTRVAHPCRGGRQPEPLGRQRRTAGHRQVVRFLADDPRPHRGRLLTRARRLRAVVRGPRRPLRPQDDDRCGHGALDSCVPRGSVRAVRHGAVRGSGRGRPVGRHGVSHDPRADHRAVERTRSDPLDRAVVRPRGWVRDAGTDSLRAAARAVPRQRGATCSW